MTSSLGMSKVTKLPSNLRIQNLCPFFPRKTKQQQEKKEKKEGERGGKGKGEGRRNNKLKSVKFI